MAPLRTLRNPRPQSRTGRLPAVHFILLRGTIAPILSWRCRRWHRNRF